MIRLSKKYGLLFIFLLFAVLISAPVSMADVIIDNGGAGTSYTGTWSLSGGTSPYGSTSVWSRNGTTYTFSMNGQTAGTYEVLMWWSGWSSRAPSVPVAINYTGGTSNTTVNQQQNAGQWNSLGTFYFNGAGSVIITAATGDTLSTCADAVRFRLVSANAAPVAAIDSITPSPADVGANVTFTGHGTDSDGTVTAYEWVSSKDGTIGTTESFSTAALSSGTHTISFRVKDNSETWSVAVTMQLVVGTPSAEVIIDNGQAGTSYTGTWTVSGGINPYGANSAWSRNGTTYTFTMSGQPAGTYEVFMWWSGYSSRASSVPVAINYTGGTSNTTVNQKQNYGQWNSLGKFYFDGTGSVTITAATGSTISTCADAVKFTLVSTNQAPQATIDSITPNPADAGQSIAFTGHGTDSDGSITGYEWTSSLDGAIGSTATFSKSTLSAGTHTISFRVKDNTNAWSTPVTASLVVQAAANVPPTAVIDSITPNPASSGQTVTFTGHGTDSDGTVTAYEWSSSINGIIGTTASFSSSTLSAGTHTITLKVMDNANAWSNAATSSVTISAPASGEHIYVIDGYSKDAVLVPSLTKTLLGLGAKQVNDTWVYTNKSTGKTFVFHFVTTPVGFMDALRQPGAHIVFNGHSNFGLGGSFAQGYEVYEQEIDAIRYIDDDRFAHISTPMVSVKIDGVQYGQAYPNWLPIFKNGANGVMPYTFAEGMPPYNYYLAYKVPGDPTLYKIELSNGSNLERFPDSGFPAWFSPDGLAPSPTENPEYFIVNDDADYNRCDFVGTWPIAKEADDLAEYSAYNYQYHAAGSGSNSATWTLVVRNAGYYQVTATWQSAATNASNATYTIEHDGGTTTVVADQRIKTGGYPLGTFYFSPGSYKVRLTDKANGRVVADSMRLSSISGLADRLQAEFSAAVLTGTAPLTVAFKDLSEISSSTGDTITSWFWDFGDGTTSTTRNPEHVYSQAGVYTVALTVTSGLAAQDTEIKTGVIRVGSTGDLRALFAADTRNVTTRTSVQFTDMSSGNVTSWLWNFGDGTTSTERNPVYRFRTAGTYTVSLTVQSSSGTDTITNTGYVRSVRSAYTVIADNAYHYKPHFFDYSGSYGKTILYGNTAISESELKYSRIFYSSCNSCNYYTGTFHRGIMYCTTSDADLLTAHAYIKYYISGMSDDLILRRLNAAQNIHEMINFNLKPPSLR